VIRGQRTADETLATLTEFATSLGKTPVQAKDTPGFIVNRVARPFYGEALKILGEHGAKPEMVRTMDAVLKEAGGFKMGPFELMDLIGIDVNLAVTQSVWNAYFQLSRYRPHPIQQRMVYAGLLGRKTGEGFYRYDR
jgi:3-hydroxybutyryl-CoA dehydrogenase